MCFCVNRFRRTDRLPPPDVGAGPASGMSEKIARIRRTSVNLRLREKFRNKFRDQTVATTDGRRETPYGDVYIRVSGSLENTIFFFIPGFS